MFLYQETLKSKLEQLSNVLRSAGGCQSVLLVSLSIEKWENSKITIECHNLIKLSILLPLNHFSFLTQNLLNPFDTYCVTATWLEKSIVLTHV